HADADRDAIGNEPERIEKVSAPADQQNRREKAASDQGMVAQAQHRSRSRFSSPALSGPGTLLSMVVPLGCGKAMGSTIAGAPPGFRPDLVQWRDLATTTPADAIRELLLPIPWLAGSLILADLDLYPPALIASFVFFLTGLRVVHGAFHYTLGLPRRATDCVMFAFSLVMLGSMHAVQWNHLPSLISPQFAYVR